MFNKKKKGSALYMVLMIMSILMVLGVAISGLAVSNYKMRKLSDNSTKNLYIAEAGIDEAYIMISEIVDEELKEYIILSDEDKELKKSNVMVNIITAINNNYNTIILDTAQGYDDFGGVRTLMFQGSGTNVNVKSTFKANSIEREISADYEIIIDLLNITYTLDKKNWTIVK